MKSETVTLTLIDGPTLLIELGGLRILTDPTFDEPKTFTAGGATVRKLNVPPVSPDSLLPLDAILLSHDQHFDNLDSAGRALLPRARRVISTVGAAERLGGNTDGLVPWSSTELPLPDGGTLTITSTPARHGPAGIEQISGHVTGFVLSTGRGGDIYISGDTVWIPEIAEVAHRFDIGLAVLFTGAAQPTGPFRVTMDSNDAIEAASALPDATIVAVHNNGWSHYTQSQEDLRKAFEIVGMEARFQVLHPAVAVPVEVGPNLDTRARARLR